jgi:glycosyltransferase involved in cell wall biosynthesis
VPAPRVLVVAPLYHPDRGGLGRQAVLLAERLAELGVHQEVATRYMRGLPDYPFSPQVKIHRIPAGRPNVHNYETPNLENLMTSVAFSFGVVLLLLRNARRFDVIHFHGASLPLLIVLPFAKLLRIPLLALVAATHQGVEAGDMRRHPGVGIFLAWAFAQVDGYIAITAEVERLLAAEGVSKEGIARVPFFVDVETFKPLPPKERDQVRTELGLADRAVVVHSGRLVPRKGGDVLIRAFAKASAKVPSSKPLLLFLGDGPERASLEALARTENVAENVRFAGFVEDVPRWLAASDVLVLASRIEGLPNALLEALGMGLACIATKIAGAEEVIDDGLTGVLVTPGDEAELAAAIERLLQDEPYRKAIGRAAATRVRGLLSREVIAPRYLEIYEDLAGGHSVARTDVPSLRVVPRVGEEVVTPSARAPRVARRRRPLRVKLTALAISSMVTLGLVEIGARLVLPEAPQLAGKPLGKNAFHESLQAPNANASTGGWFPYRVDRQQGFGLIANIDTSMTFYEAPNQTYRLRTNALGIRDDRPLTEKKGKRILVVGDSMTFGIGVEREQAFSARLEEKTGIETVNAGCCMWGQGEEDAFLEHRAPALSPDLVILEFTVANDVLDDLRYGDPEDLVPDSTLGNDLAEHPIFSIPILADYSRAYRQLMWYVGRHIVRYRAMKERWRLERAWALIHRARDLSRKLGARFLLVIAPTAAQLEHTFSERLLATHAINEFILAEARDDGIDACDPTAALEKVYAKKHTPYFPFDKHWNPEGHDAVAGALAPLVKELLK